MIMTKKEDGTYKQVGFIYRNDEIDVSGEVPVEFKTMDGTIGNYMIEGNTYQSDGISPDNPVEVQAVGDRTGNLFNGEIQQGGLGDTNGAIATSSNRVRTTKINVTENTYYTVTSNLMIRNIIAYNNGTFVSRLVGSTSDIAVFSIPVGVTQIAISFKGNEEGTVEITPNDLEWLMLNEGTEPLPYEPYGYKIPVETKGKNLLEITDDNSIYYGTLNGYTINDNKVHVTGQTLLGFKVEVQPNTTYTMRRKRTPNVTSDFRIREYSAELTDWMSNHVIQSVNTTSDTATFTTSAETKWVLVTVYVTANQKAFTIYDLQLELGSTATEYEPYHEPITTPIYLDFPLYKNGNYADAYGMTEEVRAIKELILTGDENWSLQSINQHGLANLYINVSPLFVVGSTALCSHFTAQKTLIAQTTDEGIYLSNNNLLYIRIRQEIVSTATAFKTWLKEQYNNGTPVKVYYVLAEPETEFVELPKIPTLDGTNIIDINTEIKPSNISLSRPMTEIKKIFNKEGKILFEKGFTREVESVLPLTLNSIGKPLKNYTLYGNTIQNGSPTPDTPVEVHAVGDRTGNLLRFTDTNSINAGGAVISQTADKSEIVIVSRTATETDSSAVINAVAKLAAGTYTLYVEGLINHGVRTLDRIYIRDKDKNVIVNNVQTGKPQRFTISEDVEITGLSIVFADVSEYSNQVVRVMLNEGETALPYEPYGYKVPITTESEDGTESITTAYLDKPLYKIGDYADSVSYAEQKVERFVKELVLDGTENWYGNHSDIGLFTLYTINDYLKTSSISLFNTHYPSNENANSWEGVQDMSCCLYKNTGNTTFALYIRDSRFNTLADFKAFLAEQYANGTPVKIYYVLEKPETESVTLPKIPTLDGTTVIDVETEIEPSNMNVKYKSSK